MNTVKNFTTFHLQLNKIDVLEVVILLMTYLIMYVFQTKQDLSLSILNMITGINESKELTKHISCECKCRFDGRKRNSDQWWNNDKCCCKCKTRDVCEKNYVWNPATFSCENGKYSASIMDDSTIICDEVIDEDVEAKSNDEIKTIPTNFNERKTTYKAQNIYILLAFLLITIALLIAVSIYCYLIKYQAKQKHLLPFQFKIQFSFSLKILYIKNISQK